MEVSQRMLSDLEQISVNLSEILVWTKFISDFYTKNAKNVKRNVKMALILMLGPYSWFRLWREKSYLNCFWKGLIFARIWQFVMNSDFLEFKKLY